MSCESSDEIFQFVITFQAFAAVSVVEYWMRRSGRNEIYSEQNLIDCDRGESTGCNGDAQSLLMYEKLEINLTFQVVGH